MADYDIKEVERLTGFSDKTRRELAGYYAKMPDEIRLEVHKLQSILIRKNIRTQKNKSKSTEFFYAYFLLALHLTKKVETGQSRKAPLTPEELQRIEMLRRSRIRGGHKRKGSPLREIIEIQYYELIRKLRSGEEGLSWRDISDYIARFHKRRISHTYLKSTYEQITRERALRGEYE